MEIFLNNKVNNERVKVDIAGDRIYFSNENETETLIDLDVTDLYKIIKLYSED